MTKIIKKVKRFFNQTHVREVIRFLCQAILVAVLAAAILFLVMVIINLAVV